MSNISVVVPFYNRSFFFKRLLDGIENQTYPIETIYIIDNGSDVCEIEEIYSYIKKSESNIVLISSLSRGNANYARNLGYLLATTKYVAYLDSDDWWDPDHISKSIKKLEVSNKYACYSGASIHFPDKIFKINKSYNIDSLPTPFHLILSNNGYIAQTSSYVINKNLLMNQVIWDEDLKRHQDYDYFLNIYYKTMGWVYLDSQDVNIDWCEGGTKIRDIKSKILFINKWMYKFPKDILADYSYNKYVQCIMNEKYYKYKDEFREIYFKSKRKNVCLKKIVLSNVYVKIRYLYIKKIFKYIKSNK